MGTHGGHSVTEHVGPYRHDRVAIGQSQELFSGGTYQHEAEGRARPSAWVSLRNGQWAMGNNLA